ncbi:hypothetical protein C0J52_22789 [Blattella germanica]|nr:hypothetical protein C0J52_22789 [Blattella germanica]
MGYVKDSVFVPSLPVDLLELRACIINAFEQIKRYMFGRVWDELDYRLDICRITRGSIWITCNNLEENQMSCSM